MKTVFLIFSIAIAWLVWLPFGQSECTCTEDCYNNCTSGKFWNGSVLKCTECTIGYYCPGGDNATRISCSNGQYQPGSGMSSCEPCPGGYSCTNGAAKSPCPAGTYSLMGVSSCQTCPMNRECPEKTTNPKPCNPGSYVGTGAICVNCEAGTFCLGQENGKKKCPVGQYQIQSGQTSCEACPVANSCLNPASNPVRCHLGEYSYKGNSNCTPCPPGTYRTNSFNECQPCPSGSQCLNLTIDPIKCLAGHFSLSSQRVCSSCPFGTFSNEGSSKCSLCPPGKSCPDPKQTPQDCSSPISFSTGGVVIACTSCPGGYSCNSPTLPPKPCQPGYYSLIGKGICYICPAGSECPLPDGLPQKCAIGSSSDLGSSRCKPCQPGYACTSNSTIACKEVGEYVSGNQCKLCPVGRICPMPSISPILCSQGYTTDSKEGQSVCTPCPAGKYCSNPSSPVEACSTGYYSLEKSTSCNKCPNGHECSNPGGLPVPCLEGQLSTITGTACQSCKAGHFCPDPQAVSGNEQECPLGSYAIAKQTKCTVCPAGFACPDKTIDNKVTCKEGTFAIIGSTACKNCPAGWQCPLTSGDQNSFCPKGFYSIGQQTECTECPAGTPCFASNMAPSIQCKPGYYALVRSTSCTKCPPGKACPHSTGAGIIDCLEGEYSPGGQTLCSICPAGFKCSNRFTDMIEKCPLGTFSLEKSVQCTQCPSGKFCPEVTVVGMNCLDGYYSLQGATECTRCPPGSYCPVKNTLPTICAQGTYSTGEGKTCRNCSAGYACPEGSVSSKDQSNLCPRGGYCEDGKVATPCPSGQYGYISGAISKLEGCKDCPAGHYCPLGTSGLPLSPLFCPAGYYCPSKTGDYKVSPCPEGQYNIKLGAAQITECHDCLPGRFCPAGSDHSDQVCPPGYFCLAKCGKPEPCPEGTFSGEEGMSSSSSCTKCLAGHFCPSGTVSPYPCKPGFFNSMEGRTNIKDCQPCSSGHSCTEFGLSSPNMGCEMGYYCPGGNTRPDQEEFACPAGTFTNQNDLVSESECMKCPERWACSHATGGKQKLPKPCKPGYYCPAGSKSDTEIPCPAGSYSDKGELAKVSECTKCPRGKFCLPGGTAPTGECTAGHYCPEGTQYSTQWPCKLGSYSDKTGLGAWEECTPCKVGHYCTKGSTIPIPCVPGTFNDGKRNQDVTSCRTCPAGTFCSSNGTSVPFPCSKGSYSSSGSETCSPCQSGYYCDVEGTSKDLMYKIKVCPPGIYCPIGVDSQPNLVTHPCPKGSYCPGGNIHAEPVNCPNGTFNSILGRKQVSECQKCRAGYYCNDLGMKEPTGECPGGYFCPEGTINPKENPCPIGFYRNGASRESYVDCTECISGFYCDEIGLADPKVCTAGYYCTSGTIRPLPCPLGTYSNTTGLRRSSDCAPCPGGRYCDGVGLTRPTGPCDPGFYCREKAYNSAPPDGPTGGICIAGGYCPAGSAYPFACPKGYYVANKGSKSKRDCVLCQPGYYCPGAMLENSFALKCAAGYYCTGGAETPTQKITSPGHYSTIGSFKEEPCQPGTYRPDQGSDHCLDCLKGYFCNVSAMITQQICLPGHFCPPRSVTPIKCKIGTFNDKPAMEDKSQCRSCTPGKACTSVGLVKPDANCSAGYACKKGSPFSKPSNSSYGGPCKLGHYCVEGTAFGDEQPCPPRTFANLTGLVAKIKCQDCLAGQYCASSGLVIPSGLCQAGYFCNNRSQTHSPEDGVQGDKCPIGMFCHNGSASGTYCPDGSYASTPGHINCDLCPTGFFCISGEVSSAKSPEKCPPGHYCPPSSGRNHTKCPTGTFNDKSGGSNSSACLPCPAGKACIREASIGWKASDPSGSITGVVLCAEGFYCKYGVDVEQPANPGSKGTGEPCEPGAYCPKGTTAPLLCPAGTYRNVSGGSNEKDCFPCPGGKFCSGMGNISPTGDCREGYYCKSGATKDSPTINVEGGPCTKGHYCPMGVSKPHKCPAGTYNKLEGRANCTNCPAGYYCEIIGQEAFTAYTCPSGYFCPEKTKDKYQFPCPMGTFRASEKGKNISFCTPCSAGYYCSSEGLSKVSGPCEAGYFCVSGSWNATPPDSFDDKFFGNLTCFFRRNMTAGICPLGHYCEARTSIPTPCPGGKYCPTTGIKSKSNLPECSAGYYCSKGASRHDPIDNKTGGTCPIGRYCHAGSDENQSKCPRGTFSNLTGLKDASQCEKCMAGFYCSDAGMSKPNGPCAPGYYCPSGQSNGTAFPCTSGHFCKGGNDKPEICESGYWQNETRQTSCIECLPGYYCNKNLMKPITILTGLECPKGFYCPGKTMWDKQFPCPSGTYSNVTGLPSMDKCKPCDRGRYCTSTGLQTVEGLCAKGHFCGGGATLDKPINESDNRLCSSGHFCKEGATTESPCPIGTWSNSTGLEESGQCTLCISGSFCNQDGLIKPTGFCDPGYFCTTGAKTARPTDGKTGDICPKYRYCPKGTGIPLVCEDGKYSNTTMATSCSPCPEGFICVSNTTTIRCSKGQYCPPGSGPMGKLCPSGTFGETDGLSDESQCKQCDGGFYCSVPGATNTTGICDEGYFCKLGAKQSKPWKNTLNNGPCPKGHFCPKKTASPKPCPIGTFSNHTMLTNEYKCTNCTPGYFCNAPGIDQPTDKCNAGFFCAGRAKTGNSNSLIPGIAGPCPVGHFCKIGTEIPEPCHAGTFAIDEKMAACISCPAGFFCPPKTSNYFMNVCPSGYYCPAGTKTQTENPCKQGFYNPDTQKATIDDCRRCELGHYCNSTGLKKVSGQCDAGWFCKSGSTSSRPTDPKMGGICQIGEVCVKGSHAAKQCPAGSYCDSQELGRPTGQCDKGYYCQLGSSRRDPPNGECTPGHYCPVGSAVPKPCPIGTFSVSIKNPSNESCKLCTEGFFCDSMGQTRESGRCKSGYFCPSGQNTSTPVEHICKPGFKCPEGSSAMEPCLPGNYQNKAKQDNCEPCPKGFFCDSKFDNKTCSLEIQIPQYCPQGSYCPSRSSSPELCPIGTYNSRNTSDSIDDCLSCPAGKYCAENGLSVPSGPCAAGYYCKGRATVLNPTDTITGELCPQGSYCPSSTNATVSCPKGTFGASAGLGNEKDCTNCTAGQYCDSPGLSSPTGQCGAGFFCLEGSSQEKPDECPLGYICPMGSARPKRCPDGKWASAPQLESCEDCPAGMQCINGSHAQPCPKGYYCPVMTGIAIRSCPIGTFSDREKLTDILDCTFCTDGFYCGQENLQKPSGPCNPGFFCRKGAKQPNPVLYQDEYGPCPSGFYCPKKTTDPIPCKKGTYNPMEQAHNVSQCKICPAGKYCNGVDLSKISGICQSGYFCTEGSTTSRPSTGKCSPGFYCTAGSSEQLPCEAGTYNPRPQSSTCISCPSGFYCGVNDTKYNACPTGSYCPPKTKSSTQFICSLGKFNDKVGQRSELACKKCPAGSYCNTPTKVGGLCDAGFYCTVGSYLSDPSNITYGGGPCKRGSFCPKGSKSPTPCRPGSYCEKDFLGNVSGVCDEGYFCKSSATTPTPTDEFTGNICPIGHYCPKNSSVPTPCPSGSYLNRTKGQNSSECIQCDPGFYCHSTGLSQVEGPCAPGFYCPLGSKIDKPPKTQCPWGNKCPDGSKTPTQCLSGTYQNLPEKSECLSCPAGKYCNSNDGSVISPKSCPLGSYCPANTTMDKDFLCPIGTYGGRIELKSIDECSPCTPGYACPNEGISSAPVIRCKSGYYCVLKATTRTPTNLNKEGGEICPKGSYCIEGSSTGEPCPIGTFGESLGLESKDICKLCTPGYYCESTGLINVTGECQAGYYCPVGSSKRNLGNNKCGAGSYCPKGSSEPIRCRNGTFQAKPGSDTCSPCTQGYYCDQEGIPNVWKLCSAGFFCPNGTSIPVEVCPRGHYCPKGASLPKPCSAGTLANETQLFMCPPCPQGLYCPTSELAIICPMGHYCPRGTGYNQHKCPIGTFGNSTGLSGVEECSICSGGQFCETEGSQVPTGECDAGYYCTSGVNIKNPSTSIQNTGTGNVCFKGHFCPKGSTYSLPCQPGSYSPVSGRSECLPCPKGFYCLEKTIDPRPCKQGYYCPEGTKSDKEFPCPPGTYSRKLSVSNESECSLCSPGSYCDGNSPTSPNGLCNPGYYCISGSSSARPIFIGSLSGGSTLDLLSNNTCAPPWNCTCPSFIMTRGGVCPQGYFCPKGTILPRPCTPGMFCSKVGLAAPEGNCEAGYVCRREATNSKFEDCPVGNFCPERSGEPVPCPKGTFGDKQNGKKAGDCHQCTSGKYCEGTGNNRTSGECRPGFYCPLGSFHSSSKPCTIGCYCPLSSPDPVPCLAGFYTDKEGYAQCLSCPAGYFCNHNPKPVGIPTICPKGYFCPNNTQTNQSFPCPIGTFGNIDGLKSKEECSVCSLGKFCPTEGLQQPQENCLAGYFCNGAAINKYGKSKFVSESNICPLGHYCPSGSGHPIRCPEGTYGPGIQATNVSHCQGCLGGRYCNGTGLIDGKSAPLCDLGYICTGSSKSPRPTDASMGYICPRGHFCEEGAFEPKDCPIGTYQPNKGQGNCDNCPERMHCPNTTTIMPSLCTKGYYCPGNGTLPQPCPPGTLNSKKGRFHVSHCISCLTGYYCEGFGNEIHTGQCEKGYYCEGGATNVIPSASTKFPNNGLCPKGHYCTKGTLRPMPCPTGSYRNITGAPAIENCTACLGGYYCYGEGLTKPTGLCHEGFYCPNKIFISTPNPALFICPINHFCPKGSTNPKVCSPGTWQANKGQSRCTLCPAGYYCVNSSSKFPCPAHNYCPAGSNEPKVCYPGTYTLSTGSKLQNPNGCKPCPAGKYCRSGKVSGNCSAGFYCRSGSSSPTPSQLPPSESCHNETMCSGVCPSGHYCLIGTTSPTPCPKDTLRETKEAANLSDCRPCPAGFICNLGDPVKKPCPQGFYCPINSEPIICPMFSFRNTTKGKVLSDCLPCPAGYYCNQKGIAYYSRYPCPLGFYCLKSSEPVRCAAGTMRPTTNAASQKDCLPCTAGYYCPVNRTNINGIICSPGYECPSGSSQQMTCRAGHYCRGGTGTPPKCPSGYYCPAKTINPILCVYPYFCPNGTKVQTSCPEGYGAATGIYPRINQRDSCTLCNHGYYSGGGLCVPCPAGYYCPFGTRKGEEKPCKAGTYCPLASEYPRLCNVGYFNIKDLSEKCSPCPSDTYQNIPGQTFCKPCGGSSYAHSGSSICSCYGHYRTFQISDASCQCNAGYIYYDEADRLRREGDSRRNCQPLVDVRCSSKEVHDANTRLCVDPDIQSCNNECEDQGGGSYNPEFGRCFCNVYEESSNICNRTCLETIQPKIHCTVSPDGTITLIGTEPTNGTSATVRLPGSIGPNDQPSSSGRTLFVNFWPDRVTGVVPTSLNDTFILTQALNSFSGSRLITGRRRLLALLNITDGLPQIMNPVLCVEYQEMVVFRVYIVPSKRSSSNYPVYDKDNMMNNNPTFDYAPFLRLKYLIVNTTIDISSFAYTFTAPGKYVFSDSQNSDRIVLISVLSKGAVCSPTHSRIQPSSLFYLEAAGFNKLNSLNLAPNWGLIAGVLLFLAACIFIIISAVVIWRPNAKSWFHFYHRVSHVSMRGTADGADGYLEISGASKLCSNNTKLLEDFSAYTFLDKIEDQNLHVVSQLARQREDTKEFFATLCKKNDRLCLLLESKMKASGSGGGSPEVVTLNSRLKELLDGLISGNMPFVSPQSTVGDQLQGGGVDSSRVELLRRITELEKELHNSDIKDADAILKEHDIQQSKFLNETKEKCKKNMQHSSSNQIVKLLENMEDQIELKSSQLMKDRNKKLNNLKKKLLKRRIERSKQLQRQCRSEGMFFPDVDFSLHEDSVNRVIDKCMNENDLDAAESLQVTEEISFNLLKNKRNTFEKECIRIAHTYPSETSLEIMRNLSEAKSDIQGNIDSVQQRKSATNRNRMNNDNSYSVFENERLDCEHSAISIQLLAESCDLILLEKQHNAAKNQIVEQFFVQEQELIMENERQKQIKQKQFNDRLNSKLLLRQNEQSRNAERDAIKLALSSQNGSKLPTSELEESLKVKHETEEERLKKKQLSEIDSCSDEQRNSMQRQQDIKLNTEKLKHDRERMASRKNNFDQLEKAAKNEGNIDDLIALMQARHREELDLLAQQQTLEREIECDKIKRYIEKEIAKEIKDSKSLFLKKRGEILSQNLPEELKKCRLDQIEDEERSRLEHLLQKKRNRIKQACLESEIKSECNEGIEKLEMLINNCDQISRMVQQLNPGHPIIKLKKEEKSELQNVLNKWMNERDSLNEAILLQRKDISNNLHSAVEGFDQEEELAMRLLDSREEELLRNPGSNQAEELSRIQDHRKQLNDSLEARISMPQNANVERCNQMTMMTENLRNEQGQINSRNEQKIAEILLGNKPNLLDLESCSSPEKSIKQPTQKLVSESSIPDEATIINLIAASPIYKQMDAIRKQMEEINSPNIGDVQDEKDKVWCKDSSLVPVAAVDLEPRHFIVYKYGCFLLKLLQTHCGHKEINLLIASKIPPNPEWKGNAYQNSFAYNATNHLLYIRLARLDSVGEFSLIIAHCSAHINIGSMSNDSLPEFMREFHRCLACIYEDLWTKSGLPESPRKTLDISTSDLVSLRTLPHTDLYGLEFNKNNVLTRLPSYSSFIRGQDLYKKLASLEDNMRMCREQGTSEGITAGERSAGLTPWHISSDTISKLSGSGLIRAFENIKDTTTRNVDHSTQDDRMTSPEINMIDALDNQIASLSRQQLEANDVGTHSKHVQHLKQMTYRRIKAMTTSNIE